MKRSLSIFSFLSLMACQSSVPPPVDVRYLDDTDLEGTVSVIKNHPKENSVDVALDEDIWIEFSDRVRRSSVNSFRFQVLDEFGIPIQGKISYEKDNTLMRFTPRYGSRRANLNRATTYTVHARYLEDESGYLVGNFSFKFRTVDKAKNTGAFYIKEIHPNERLILPGDEIAVEFSEEVAPAPYSPDGCSTSMWSDAFQVLKAPLLNTETGLTGVSGKICRVYNKTSNKWDTLVFVPDDQESILRGGEYVDIVIRPTFSLRGAQSGEELAPDGAEQVRAWVIPIDLLTEFLF